MPLLDLQRLRLFARATAVSMFEDGGRPANLVDGDKDEFDVLKELDELLDRQGPALAGATVDFVLDLIRAVSRADPGLDEFARSLTALSADELASIAEHDAGLVSVTANRILTARRELVEDVKATLSTIARGALMSALAALVGLS